MMNWKLSLTTRQVLNTIAAPVGFGFVAALSFSLVALLVSCVQQPLQTASQPRSERAAPTVAVERPSPLPSQEVSSLEKFFGYSFQTPPELTRVSVLDPTSNYEGEDEICFGQKDETLPKTHQVVIDICVRRIYNHSDQAGASWIEQESEIAVLLEHHQDEIAWSALESPAGRWYVASGGIDIETVRYYAYLFDGKIVLRVYAHDKDLLNRTLKTFRPLKGRTKTVVHQMLYL